MEFYLGIRSYAFGLPHSVSHRSSVLISLVLKRTLVQLGQTGKVSKKYDTFCLVQSRASQKYDTFCLVQSLASCIILTYLLHGAEFFLRS